MTAVVLVAMMTTSINAGIEAMAHFTMKVTMDQNGMWISVTTTFLVEVGSVICASDE